MPHVHRFLALVLVSVARLAAADVAPLAIVTQPADVTEKAGGIASFVVAAQGSEPLRYQWFHNGTAIPGETRPVLSRAPLAAEHAGWYTVNVGNLSGSLTSSPVTLVVEPAPPPIVDAAFSADPALNNTPTALLPLPDGSILVANGLRGRLVRLRSDGTLDREWPEHVFATREPGFQPRLDILVRQPDGRILVGGVFAHHNDVPRLNLVRLNADGTTDTTFAPAASVGLANLRSLAVQRDGRIVVATGEPRPFRLLPNGSVDTSFQPAALAPVTVGSSLRQWQTAGVGLTPDDRIFAARTVHLSQSNLVEEGSTEISRLLANGAVDTSFATLRPNFFSALHPTADGGVLVSTYSNFTWPRPGLPSTPAARATSLLAADGQVRFSHPINRPLLAFPDGSFLYSESNATLRVTATGESDPSFTVGLGSVTAALAARDDAGRLFLAGEFDAHDGHPTRRVARLTSPPPAPGTRNPPRILSLFADRTVVRPGEEVTVYAAVTGSGHLRYLWIDNHHRPNVVVTGEYSVLPLKTYRFDDQSARHTIQLSVTNSTLATARASIEIAVTRASTIAAQTGLVSTQSGRDLTLSVTRHPDPRPVTYEWRRNGEPIANPPPGDGTTFLYRIPAITPASAGAYTLTLRDAEGYQVTSAPIYVVVDGSSRFTNLSTLATVHDSEPRVIAGFTLSGTTTRRVLVRGIGPGLARFGVSTPLADPVITLYDSAGRIVPGATSDNWAPALATTFSAVGAYGLETGSADAAFVADLPPGSYTATLTGKAGQTGTALVEIYEADNDAQTMRNLSARAYIAPGAPAIAGLVVRGPRPKTVLLRAIGPSLSPVHPGLGNFLRNPRLTLRNASGAIIGANDDWGPSPEGTSIHNIFNAAGAFALLPNTRDAVLALPALSPGNYTVVVESADEGAGVALLEVYEY